jgi:hypothetical protein
MPGELGAVIIVYCEWLWIFSPVNHADLWRVTTGTRQTQAKW